MIAEGTIKSVIVEDDNGIMSVLDKERVILAMLPDSRMQWMVATTEGIDTEDVLNFAYDMVDEIEMQKLEDEG